MVGEGVENFRAGKRVQAHDEDVVEDKRDGRKLVGDLVLAKNLVANVADVEEMRMTQAVPPEDERGVQHRCTDTKGGEKTTGHTEIGVCPWEGQNGKADVLGEQKHGRLLPRQSTVFDGAAFLGILDALGREELVRVSIAVDWNDSLDDPIVLGFVSLGCPFEVVAGRAVL